MSDALPQPPPFPPHARRAAIAALARVPVSSPSPPAVPSTLPALPRVSSSLFAPLLPVLPAASFSRRAAAWCWDALPFELLYLFLVATTDSWVTQAQTAVGQATTLVGPAMGVTFGPLTSAPALPWIASWGPLFLFLAYLFWHVGWEATTGSTPGKHLVGIRVAPAGPPKLALYPAPLGWVKAVLRLLGCGLSWLLMNIGHAMIRWRRDGASLHDLLTSTRVVADPSASWVNRWSVLRPVSPQGQKMFLVMAFLAQTAVLVTGVMMLFSAVQAVLGPILNR